MPMGLVVKIYPMSTLPGNLGLCLTSYPDCRIFQSFSASSHFQMKIEINSSMESNVPKFEEKYRQQQNAIIKYHHTPFPLSEIELSNYHMCNAIYLSFKTLFCQCQLSYLLINKTPIIRKKRLILFFLYVRVLQVDMGFAGNAENCQQCRKLPAIICE